MPPMEPAWSAPRRIAFRFFFVYLFLYIFPWPAGAIPGTGWLAAFVDRRYEALVPWVGSLLGLDPPAMFFPTGSGDTRFRFVLVFVQLSIAAVVTALWTALARARAYPRLHDVMRVGLRFFLAAAMLSYGMIKVWKNQFPEPPDVRLLQPFGATTKMGLLWTFMGASTSYTLFGGLSEAVGGVLLFFRRTTTLGACVVGAVMTNVVLLNFCYDVSVKQFSAHLLLMALVLVAPDVPRLVDLFVLNRPVAPVELAPSPSQRITRARQALGLLFAGYLVYSNVSESSARYLVNGDGKPPDEGYTVEAMTPPLWRHVSLNVSAKVMWVLLADDRIERFAMTRDDTAGTMVIEELFARPAKYRLAMVRPDAERLVLSGEVRGTAITVTLRRAAPARNRLRETSFQWIHEYPNNH